MEAIIIIAIIVTILVLSAYFWEGNTPRPYNARSCTGKNWKSEFPDVSKEMIREYLECFVDGMAFNSKERLKFEPIDEILKVYQSIYGGKTPFSDAMELETFYLNLTREFQVSPEYLEKVWHEHLTLGELFSHIIAQRIRIDRAKPRSYPGVGQARSLYKKISFFRTGREVRELNAQLISGKRVPWPIVRPVQPYGVVINRSGSPQSVSEGSACK